jgi:hypothetical protein
LKRIKNNRPQKEEEEEDIFLSNKQHDAGPRILCSTRAAEASDQDTKILKKEESQACTI